MTLNKIIYFTVQKYGTPRFAVKVMEKEDKYVSILNTVITFNVHFFTLFFFGYKNDKAFRAYSWTHRFLYGVRPVSYTHLDVYKRQQYC